MNTVDRCTCYQELIKHVGEGFSRFQIAEKDDACSEHGEIDDIVKTGHYVDRQGDEWVFCGDVWSAAPNYRGKIVATDAQMRLLIERDQHVCQGLRRCFDHPVPHVLIAEWDHSRFGGFMVYPAGDELVAGEYDFHDEAMDAARALAVGE